MKFIKHFVMILALLVLHEVGFGQTSAKVVKVGSAEQAYKIKKGSTAQVQVSLDIQSGYHINSNQPADKNLIATALKLDKVAGLTLTPVRYPKAKVKKFQFSPKP